MGDMTVDDPFQCLYKYYILLLFIIDVVYNMSSSSLL